MARYCDNCNQDMGFEITRRRRFCSDKCRVQFNRAQNNTQLYGDAMNAIYKLGKVPSAAKKDAIESLKTLKRAIDDALRVLGDTETISRYDMIEQRSSGIYPIKSDIWVCRECGQKAFLDPKGKSCPFCKEVAWEHN